METVYYHPTAVRHNRLISDRHNDMSETMDQKKSTSREKCLEITNGTCQTKTMVGSFLGMHFLFVFCVLLEFALTFQDGMKKYEWSPFGENFAFWKEKKRKEKKKKFENLTRSVVCGHHMTSRLRLHISFFVENKPRIKIWTQTNKRVVQNENMVLLANVCWWLRNVLWADSIEMCEKKHCISSQENGNESEEEDESIGNETNFFSLKEDQQIERVLTRTMM